ncbi:MAG: S8 family serine peptidase [Ignavibacteriaceae bacterium]|nr:S8 family serine peptidase [Ignavibacteriaceae bacterium]
MKKYILWIFILFTSFSFSQSKYFIYFVDKGVEPTEKLEKSSSIYNSALSLLSQKSIERRIKNLGDDNIITYEDLPLVNDYILQLEQIGIKIENKLRWFNAVTTYLTEDEKIKVARLTFVEKIDPVKGFVFKNPELKAANQLQKQESNLFSFDYGPSFGQLQLSDVPAVHSKGITGEGVLLGLLDTGFDWKNHESLKDATVVAEYDFIFKDESTANDSLDNPSQHNHGTLVFSIAGGFKEGSLIGSAFGSEFILAKTEDIRSEKHIEEDNYAAAIEWMESYGVDITSSSLGYSTFDPPEFSYNYSDMDGKTTIVTKAVELAFRRGVVTISSAGNEGNSSWRYITAPADGINTLAIGAVNNNNEVASFSSRGPSYDGRIKPEVVTQGVGVYCAAAGNFTGYLTASGTSVAAPIASGISALLLSAYPHLKNTQIRNILIETADNSSSPNNERGCGLLSAVKAIEFPNLDASDGTFILNKMFLTNDNIFPQTVYVQYSTDGIDYIEKQLDFDGNLKYTFKLPYLFNDELVDFYFTYDDNSGATLRDPLSNNYKFYYGSLDISLNTDLKRTYTDFIVSEPFPNPFYPLQNSFTSVSIKSSGNENLIIRIIDPLGQQVGYYSTLTVDGENRFDWYGKNENGVPLASGVYYFLIDLDGKQYSRNLVLLR